jgi:hypothetical protein
MILYVSNPNFINERQNYEAGFNHSEISILDEWIRLIQLATRTVSSTHSTAYSIFRTKKESLKKYQNGQQHVIFHLFVIVFRSLLLEGLATRSTHF